MFHVSRLCFLLCWTGLAYLRSTTFAFLYSPAHTVICDRFPLRCVASSSKLSKCKQALSMSSWPGEDDSSIESGTKSVDDYVLNVHGGKYRFDDLTMGGTATSRDFAEALYSSSSYESNQKEPTPDYEDWPRWAKGMTSLSTIASIPSSSLELAVPSNGKDVASIRIKNQYHTWEPYFAKIIPLFDSDQDVSDKSIPFPPFEIVNDVHGTLAPQGGSDNLCDANKPYPDSANVAVRFVSYENERQFDDMGICQWCLAVGTEEEKWYYPLRIFFDISGRKHCK